MKIRTDFVTNSSSSSFVTARIGINDQQLTDVMKSLHGNRFDYSVSENIMTLTDCATDLGFRHSEPQTPETVIAVLLNIIAQTDIKKAEILAKRKHHPADTIDFYEITVGIDRWGIECDDGSLPHEEITYSFEKTIGKTNVKYIF